MFKVFALLALLVSLIGTAENIQAETVSAKASQEASFLRSSEPVEAIIADLESFIPAGREDKGSVRADLAGTDPIGVANEGDPFNARRGIPNLEGFILAGGDDKGPVGADLASADLTGVAGEDGLFCARRGVPDLEGLVFAGRDDIGPVGADRAGVDLIGVASESDPFCARRRVPEL